MATRSIGCAEVGVERDQQRGGGGGRLEKRHGRLGQKRRLLVDRVQTEFVRDGGRGSVDL